MTENNTYPDIKWDYEIKVNLDAQTVKYYLPRTKIIALLKQNTNFLDDWYKPNGPSSILNINAKCRSEAINKVQIMTKSEYFKWIEYVLGIDREGINRDTISVRVWPEAFND